MTVSWYACSRYKTRDHVFVDTSGKLLYEVIHEKVVDAFYKFDDVESQLHSYVDDALR